MRSAVSCIYSLQYACYINSLNKGIGVQRELCNCSTFAAQSPYLGFRCCAYRFPSLAAANPLLSTTLREPGGREGVSRHRHTWLAYVCKRVSGTVQGMRVSRAAQRSQGRRPGNCAVSTRGTMYAAFGGSVAPSEPAAERIPATRQRRDAADCFPSPRHPPFPSACGAAIPRPRRCLSRARARRSYAGPRIRGRSIRTRARDSIRTDAACIYASVPLLRRCG